MNKARFEQLRTAISLLNEVRDAEQLAFEATPTNLQASERVQQMETGIERLDNALAELRAFTD